MTDHTFPCKDCNEVYPDAYSFVSHVETCVPVRDQALLLQDAAMFLRRWVYTTDTLFKKVKPGEWLIPMEKLGVTTVEWLKKNNLQGSITR